jgi:hypothetical protein
VVAIFAGYVAAYFVGRLVNRSRNRNSRMTDKQKRDPTELEEIIARTLHHRDRQIVPSYYGLSPWSETSKTARECWHDEARQVIGAIYGEGYQILPCEVIPDD